MNQPVTGDELLSLIQITSSLLRAFVFPSNPLSLGLLFGTERFRGGSSCVSPSPFPCAVCTASLCSYTSSQPVIIPSVPTVLLCQAELPFY